MYKKILVATDGSKSAEKAALHAINLASHCNAEIIGIYVVDVSAFINLPETVVWDNVREMLHEEGKKALDFVKREAEGKNIKVKTIIKEGSPSRAIVEASKEENADLIVVGTAGRTGLDRFLLGSISEKVLRTSEKPVLVVK